MRTPTWRALEAAPVGRGGRFVRQAAAPGLIEVARGKVKLGVLVIAVTHTSGGNFDKKSRFLRQADTPTGFPETTPVETHTFRCPVEILSLSFSLSSPSGPFGWHSHAQRGSMCCSRWLKGVSAISAEDLAGEVTHNNHPESTGATCPLDFAGYWVRVLHLLFWRWEHDESTSYTHALHLVHGLDKDIIVSIYSPEGYGGGMDVISCIAIWITEQELEGNTDTFVKRMEPSRRSR